MGNKASTQIIPSREKLMKVNVQDYAKRYVVVFDIDNTLCKSELHMETAKAAKKFHQECPLIEWKYKDTQVYGHLFLPYLEILFGYLIDQGARIVLFSSAIKERNITVIPELLASFWGKEKYQTLKSEGQFVIFSREELRAGHSIGGEGNCVKDLNVVVHDTESLLDCILVEDDKFYIAYDQKPCLYIINLGSWDLPYENEEQVTDSYCKNSTYYMLGLFKTYFEREEYKKLPLRVGLDQMLPKRENKFLSFFPKSNQFAAKMMHLGLEEVQKKVPGAIFYELNEHEKDEDEDEYDSRNHCGDNVLKETKYESFVRNLGIGNIPLSMYYLAMYLFERFQSSQITCANQTEEFYQESIVKLINNLKGTKDVRIEEGHKIYDICVIFTDTYDHRTICVPLSFIYVPNEEELENTARVTLENIQPLVDMKRSCYNQIISVGIAYSVQSFLAAYTDHYKEHKQIYLTDIYVT